MQALGPLYQHAAHRKPDAVLPQFKAAAQRSGGSAEMWEILGELLASTDAAGDYLPGSTAACITKMIQSFLIEQPPAVSRPTAASAGT